VVDADEVAVRLRVVSDQDVDDKGLGGPDLSNLPGATIIHSEDRERLGASSRKQ